MKGLIIFLLLLISTILTGETGNENRAISYYSASELDSMVYVTTSQGLVVLTMDHGNNLHFKKMLPYYFTGSDLNSEVNSDLLAILSTDSLYIYSVMERENPVLLDKAGASGVHSIKSFGDKFALIKDANAEFVGMQNGKIKSFVTFTINCNDNFTSLGTCRSFDCSYPYLFTIENNITRNIKRYKYIENENRFVLLGSIAPVNDGRFPLQVAGSRDYLYAHHSKVVSYTPPAVYDERMYCYRIDRNQDSLVLLDSMRGGPYSLSYLQMSSKFIRYDQYLRKHITGNVISCNYYFFFNNGKISVCDSNVYFLYNSLSYTKYQSGGEVRFEEYDFIPSLVKEQSVTKEYVLYQNYPNPFNPSTRISFQLNKSADVSLNIYDILGRHIRTLLNEKKGAGDHYVDFTADGLPAGVYIYKLQTGSNTSARKMILMK